MSETPSEEAERIAPYPRVEPFNAGISGVTLTALAIALFTGLADIPIVGRAETAFVVVLALSFAVPYMHFNAQRRRHLKELSAAYLRERERSSQSPLD